MTLKELIKVADYDTLVYITSQNGKQLYNGIITGIPENLMELEIWCIIPTDFYSVEIKLRTH